MFSPWLLPFFCRLIAANSERELIDPEAGTSANVLIIYNADPYGHTLQVADAIAQGAQSVAASTRVLEVHEANYKRDVYEWADAIILGSGVYNSNAAPAVLSFLNGFDFEDWLGAKVGGAFSTGDGAVAGLGDVLAQISRSLQGFGVVVVGGTSWKNAHGTGVVTNGSQTITNASGDLALARDQGIRTSKLAAIMKRSPSPSPAPSPGLGQPPSWGETWSATVSANLTQVGYDAGLVIVNFTGQCSKPSEQKMLTIYGDFDTVLTRCDLGREFIIDPPSRGGGCRSRVIGEDVDKRICEACSCPFCVRDTAGSFTHGEIYPSKTVWTDQVQDRIFGEDVFVWRGVATSKDQKYSLTTSIAYSASDGLTPMFVNVSHPLWVQTAATVSRFSREIDPSSFDIPRGCYKDVQSASAIV